MAVRIISAFFALFFIISVSPAIADSRAPHLNTTQKPLRFLQRSKKIQPFYSPDELAAIFRHAAVSPLPSDLTDEVADDKRAALFGQMLFFDRRLSADGQISCASCHRPGLAFTGGRVHARGPHGTSRDTPSLINVAYGSWFFWDGRSDSLWSQALQPFEDPCGYGSDRLQIVHKLERDPILRRAYKAIFGKLPRLSDSSRFPSHASPDTDMQSPLARAWAAMSVPDQTTVNRIFSNLGKAIEAYERRLVSFNSPFDRYVAGLKSGNKKELQAISPSAKRGLKLFVGKGRCDLCHSGPNFTDGSFHNIGLPLLKGESPDPGRADGIRLVLLDPFNSKGRYSDEIDRESSDRFTFLPAPESEYGAFKTPSLRNIALTAPYMHDGRFSNLWLVLNFFSGKKTAHRGWPVGKAERTMALIPHFSARQKADLIAFLQTLTSAPLPARLTHAPPHL